MMMIKIIKTLKANLFSDENQFNNVNNYLIGNWNCMANVISTVSKGLMDPANLHWTRTWLKGTAKKVHELSTCTH